MQADPHAQNDAERPWGRFDVLHRATRHVAAKLTVRRSEFIPMHSHRWRREVWTVLSGSGLATINGKRFHVLEGQTVFIAYHEPHSLENHGIEDLIVLETQTGSMCQQDDVSFYTNEETAHQIERTRGMPGEGVRSQMASYIPEL